MATDRKVDPDAVHLESSDGGISHLKDVDLHDKTLANQAFEATVQEHNLGVFQALKAYKRAAFWSIRTS